MDADPKLQFFYEPALPLACKFSHGFHSKLKTRENLSTLPIRGLKILVEEFIDIKTNLNMLEYAKINAYLTTKSNLTRTAKLFETLWKQRNILDRIASKLLIWGINTQSD